MKPRTKQGREGKHLLPPTSSKSCSHSSETLKQHVKTEIVTMWRQQRPSVSTYYYQQTPRKTPPERHSTGRQSLSVWPHKSQCLMRLAGRRVRVKGKSHKMLTEILQCRNSSITSLVTWSKAHNLNSFTFISELPGHGKVLIFFRFHVY